MSLLLQRASRLGTASVVTSLLLSSFTLVQAGPLAPAAHAADPEAPVFSSVSGGTRVMAAGAVRSELTAASYLRVTQPGRSTDNGTASVNVLNKLITAGAVSTRQRTTRTLAGGTMITSEAEIAGVTLLGGAVTVDAIETRATATLNGDELKRSGGTRFVGLRIRDEDLPVNIPKNFAVTIPGLAKVVINEVKGQMGGDALIKSVATGIRITLLSSYDGLSAGASIEVTPTSAKILIPKPIDGQPVFGAGYSTRATIKVGDAVRLASAPTSLMIAPAGGTNGIDLTNAIGKVSLPGLVKANGLSSTAAATVTDAETDGTMTARIADIDLLNGAITADAVFARAHVRQLGTSPPTADGGSQVLNLTIGGRAVPASVPPNTEITIPGLVKVIVNEQIRRTEVQDGITVRALHVIALPDAPKEIVGLDLEVGVASVWVIH